MVVINVKIVSMAKDSAYDQACGFVRCEDGVFTEIGCMSDYTALPGEEKIGRAHV